MCRFITAVWFATLVLQVLFPGELTLATEQATKEYEVKAAFIPNFARFVTWPDEHNKSCPFIFLVLGENPFGSALEPVNGKDINGRKAKVQYIEQPEKCQVDAHVVFISSSLDDDFRDILRHLQGKPVLTISDISGFAEAGGMIEFTNYASSIHFIINLNAVRQAHLHMNFQLLQLADRVIGK